VKQPVDILNKPSNEGIDFEKLGAVFRKNLLWVIVIFISSVLAAYLTLRYTKDLFESESELKLDIKRDATELGIKTVVEDQNLNMVSGEIEQIKSKLFINQLIDSLDLKISYYSVGNVLRDEMYKRSPYHVEWRQASSYHYDKPIAIEILNSNRFRLRVAEAGSSVEGEFGQPVKLDQSEFVITKTNHFTENDPNKYYFICNSRASLVTYISKNLQVEPLNFNANTIRIAFNDYNAMKAHDIVNKIDSLYILYSNTQKNLANQQKIDWLNRELRQIEKRIEDYDAYFENFTLKNKSNDLNQELKRTISAINKADSQRYQLNKRILELNALMDQLQSGKVSNSSYPAQLPENIRQTMEQLQRVQQERDKLLLAYNENTYAFRQKDQALKSMQDKNTEYSKNQRYYKLYEEFYLTMMQSRAQFEIAQAGSTPDFKILSHATLPTTPISPKKNLVWAIGFVGGIVLNIFFVGFLYLINNKIISLKELEGGTNVPILGVIPVTYHLTETIFHVIDNPKSVVSEAIRTLRTNLEFFSAGSVNKVISISSTVSGEGKSFLAVNLGGVIALSRKKVVLVDLDMRKSKNEKYPAGSDANKGMSTILIKKNHWKECLIGQF
jgi:tyrosine-protein kinase Etk/Wzc